jgi:chaperone modulatory protein CbpM
MAKDNLSEVVINKEAILTLTEVCELCSVEEEYIIHLVELGILEPVGKSAPNWQFSIFHLLRIKKAQRLQNGLKINLTGVALSLELLDKIKELEDHVQILKHQLKLISQL